MACEDLITACFLNDDAPLVVPELNRERTLKYFLSAVIAVACLGKMSSSRLRISYSSEESHVKAS